jgi:hypothetical protein
VPVQRRCIIYEFPIETNEYFAKKNLVGRSVV